MSARAGKPRAEAGGRPESLVLGAFCPGPPRPPDHLIKQEPTRCQAALLWADLKLHHECRHHLLGCKARHSIHEPNRCLSNPWG